MSDEPKLPQRILDLSQSCNFKVTGWNDWDSDQVILTGADVEYIGSREEAVAYMTAWQQCQDLKHRVEAHEQEKGGQVRVGLMSWFSNGDVLPKATATIQCRPQVLAFKGTQVVVPDDICGDFEFQDIRVGNKSQFLQYGNIPAQAYAARIPESLTTFLAEVGDNRIVRMLIDKDALREFGRKLSMDTCQASQDLLCIVTNISDRPQPFRAWVVGRYKGY